MVTFDGGVFNVKNCILSSRNAVPLKRSQVPQVFVTPPVETVARPMSHSSSTQLGGRMLGQRTNPEALKKISALEEELLKLRAQIAMIVTAPSGIILMAQICLHVHYTYTLMLCF